LWLFCAVLFCVRGEGGLDRVGDVDRWKMNGGRFGDFRMKGRKVIGVEYSPIYLAGEGRKEGRKVSTSPAIPLFLLFSNDFSYPV
jgi:hypothetical protein